jgi:hypothetical protein
MRVRAAVRSLLMAGSVLGTVATAAAPSAHAGYQLVGQIAIPASGTNPFSSGQFNTYDISFFDPTTQLDYVADRTNGVVDVFSAKTNSFVGQISATPNFQGIQPTPPANPAVTAISGPDGVVVVNGAVGLPNEHQLWAGDGNSTLVGFNLPGNGQISGTPISTVLSGFTAAQTRRVDEGSFDPRDNRLVFANNAALPTPYISVVNAATNQVLSQNVFNGTNGAPDTTGGGIEQSAWDRVTASFYLSVDTATGPGGIAKLDANGNVTHFYNFADFGLSTCGPTGLAVSNVGGGTQLTLACGGQSLIFDPSANGGAGKILKEFTDVQGGDQVWFDPSTGRSYITGLDPAGNRVVAVVDLNDLNNIRQLQSLSTGPGAHSVAVDPISNEIFVPVGGFTPYPGMTTTGWGTFPGSADACGPAIGNQGCVLVFALAPEPSSLPVLVAGLAGLLALGVRRTRRCERREQPARAIWHDSRFSGGCLMPSAAERRCRRL